MAGRDAKADDALLEQTRALLWGSDLKEEVFNRWTQGFIFCADEPTALIQYEGGPCAIIAPVQGFVIKQALFGRNRTDDLKTVTSERAIGYLRDTLQELLEGVSSDRFVIVSMDENENENTNSDAPTSSNCDAGQSSPKRPRLDMDSFHSCLRCTEYNSSAELKAHLASQLHIYQNQFGVLLYLYSIILTKGIEQLKNEVEDIQEPLIDGKHGHGSQSLINMLMTGKATPNVWDNEKEISGLKLYGVSTQSVIGFLSLLEHLRYCEVGWFLKNPVYPIWILGSETHLTVLFSPERRLVMQETQEQGARRVFGNFDPEGNGFISTPQLGDLMSALDLISETEYVDLMKDKLDEESLGIITLQNFLEEFFPGEAIQDTPRRFKLYHYNGLRKSCAQNKVVYFEAEVRLEDDLEVQVITDSSPIKTCLQTKWPTIELQWKGELIPSIN